MENLSIDPKLALDAAWRLAQFTHHKKGDAGKKSKRILAATQQALKDLMGNSSELVKGGDYKPEEIAGSKDVWANGGEVLVLNFEDGCSTTNIIKKIQLDKKG